jgi:hypothetical protein
MKTSIRGCPPISNHRSTCTFTELSVYSGLIWLQKCSLIQLAHRQGCKYRLADAALRAGPGRRAGPARGPLGLSQGGDRALGARGARPGDRGHPQRRAPCVPCGPRGRERRGAPGRGVRADRGRAVDRAPASRSRVAPSHDHRSPPCAAGPAPRGLRARRSEARARDHRALGGAPSDRSRARGAPGHHRQRRHPRLPSRRSSCRASRSRWRAISTRSARP